jgi:hypothetical protein
MISLTITIWKVPMVFWDIGVPLVILGGTSILLPFLLVPKDSRSQLRVSLAFGLCVAVMILLSTLVYLLFDDRDIALGIQIHGVIGYLLELIAASSKTAMLWGPLLAVHWVSAAKRVEKLREQDLVRKG